MAKFDKKMGAILAKHGLLSDEEKERFISQASKAGTSLSKTLIENGVVTEPDLLGCLSVELGRPAIDLEKIEIPENILERISEENCRQYQVLPISEIGGMLTVAVANPFDILTLDDIRIVTGCDLMPVISTDLAIERALAKSKEDENQKKMSELISDFNAEMSEVEEEAVDEDVDIANLSEDSPIIKMTNLIIYNAIKLQASDIHFEPFETRTRLRYRIDGSCQEFTAPPKTMHVGIVSRIKLQAQLDIAEHFLPQDGKIRMIVEGRKIDLRVSTLPLIHGEKLCIRVLDSSALALSLADLGFEPEALGHFRWAVNAPYGMILVTGPTGSGKTTTLYSALKETLCIEDNISTVEDPVEYVLEGVNQCQTNERRGMTFSAALRSLLRQDPDTIMIGEIRDKETVDIAIKAALTGHLMLSTLHSNDGPTTVTRLTDMGVDKFNVASATLLISSQRLMRKVCPECRVPWDPPRERLLEIGVKEEELETGTWFQTPEPDTNTCSFCGGRGVKGRFAVLETLVMSEAVQRIIIQGKTALDIRAQALEDGMMTLRRCALLNAMRGKTTIAEVLTVTQSDEFN